MTSVHTCVVNCQISIIAALFRDAVTCFHCAFLSYISLEEGSHFDCSCFSDGGSDLSACKNRRDPCTEDGNQDTDSGLNSVYEIYKIPAFWQRTLLIVFHALTHQVK